MPIAQPTRALTRACRLRHVACAAALVACVAAAALAQPSRPVDTLQFGLLDLGMSTAEVHRRLGPPAHVEATTRTALVPVRDRFARRKHDAPAYVVRTTEIEWWYYPGGSGMQETRLEFRNGYLWSKDKYR